MAKTAAILIIGNEILSGKVPDDNGPFLIRELRALGVELRKIVLVGDDPAAIAAEIVPLARDHEVVFTSGGVGPTHDDVTITGIARGFGVPVARHPRMEALLRRFYGEQLTAAHLRSAEVPQGAELLDHPSLRFPVLCFRNVYIFPGVPEIFRKKFTAIRERFRGAPFHLRAVYVREGEGTLAPHLEAVVAAYPAASLGSYPAFDHPEYRVKITVESKDAETLEAATAALLARLDPESVVKVE